MNRIQTAMSSAHDLANVLPVVLSAITVSTTEDVIRGVIAVVVVGAIVYQSVMGSPGQAIDPWLQSIATLLVGYYFGLAQSTTKAVLNKPAPPPAPAIQKTKGGK